MCGHNRGYTSCIRPGYNVRRYEEHIRALAAYGRAQPHMGPQALLPDDANVKITGIGQQVWRWCIAKVQPESVFSALFNQPAQNMIAVAFCACTLLNSRAAGIDANQHRLLAA